MTEPDPAAAGAHVTVNVQGSVVTERDLLNSLQRLQMQRHRRDNPEAGEHGSE